MGNFDIYSSYWTDQ